VRVVLANRSASDAELELRFLPDPGTDAAVAPARLRVPAGARREAEITAQQGDRGAATGRLEARSGAQTVLVHPVAAVTADPAPPPLGPLELRRRGGRVTGVRFPLGAFDLGDPLTTGTRLELIARLDLALLGPGGTVARLTPRAGARELLPAEYGYTLPRATARALAKGPHRFRARARAPLGGAPAEATSEPFRP
jgi:hypothetical protein